MEFEVINLFSLGIQVLTLHSEMDTKRERKVKGLGLKNGPFFSSGRERDVTDSSSRITRRELR